MQELKKFLETKLYPMREREEKAGGMTKHDQGYRECLDKVIDQAEIAMKKENAQDKGEISDGYHTFNELYDHRMILFSVICNQNPEISWKSKKHHDGTMFDNYFIVGIDTPGGQATYHYHMENWEHFKVKELEKAPEWDGHTSHDVRNRIRSIPVAE